MAVKDAFDNNQNVVDQCEWDFGYELRLITRTLSFDKAVEYLDAVCENAHLELWSRSPDSAWTDVDPQFTPSFMDEYTDRGTFLNTGTGNFQKQGRHLPHGECQVSNGRGFVLGWHQH